MFLSIVIPTLNRRQYIIECLKELCQQSQEFSDVEIIVVDNASTDGTAEAVKSFATTTNIPCKYVLEEERGSNIARNRGCINSCGKIVAIIDDDAIPHKHWVSRLRQHFLDGRSDGIAGRVELRLEVPLPKWFPDNLQWILGKTEYGDHTRVLHENEFPQSNNCAFHIKIFDDLIGFNPNSLIYGDETEFFRRAREKGFLFIYRHDISVDHCIPADRLTKTGLYKKGYLWGRGDAMYWMLFSSSLIKRTARIVEYAARAAYVGLRWLFAPKFERAYTFNFNYGHVKQLILGIKSTQAPK